MNPIAKRLFDIAIVACTMYGVGMLAYNLYAIGFMSGFRQKDTAYVKKGLVKEGNILKYPFGKTRRKETKTSDSNCSIDSETQPEGAA